MEQVENFLGDFWNPSNWLGAGFYAIIFCLVAMAASRLIRLASTRVLMREGNVFVDRTVVSFLTQLAQIMVYVIGLIVFFHIVPALNKLGTALLTGVSVMSVVFGLAAQNTLSNLVAGCTLLLYRPFHLDDLIQVATPTGTEYGIIERLTLGYTMLRTLDDRLVIIPNSLMASQVSLNLNRRSLHAMAIVPIGVTDVNHIGEVREAMLDAARKDPRIHQVVGCRSQSLDDYGAVLSLRAWCASIAVAAEIQKDITAFIQQKFAPQGVVFPSAEPFVPKKPVQLAAGSQNA